jgi:hypothetical protein
MNRDIDRRQATPGYAKNIKISHFEDGEQKIIHNLSYEWYITNGGGVIRPIEKFKSHSAYKYFLMKPTEFFRTMFNIEREIAVLFSPYSKFEPRTFDAIDIIFNKYEKLRLEKICTVLISKDLDVEQKVTDILKNDQESQIIIPFSYNELLNSYDKYFLRNRFRKHFYSRDLFSFEAPLKKDLFFFGRKDIVHQIVNRHLSNENSGIFGLRKTGKTSLIFAVERVMKKDKRQSIFIDCQNPAFHTRKWNTALWYILNEIFKKQQGSMYLSLDQLSQNYKVSSQYETEEKYTENNAPILFEKNLLKLYKSGGNKNILIIFDEIENISFSTSPSDHWANGLDFVLFWQTIRSVFQKLDDIFSFLIVGTNPMCIETPQIQDKDNPIYQLLPYQYIPRFQLNETKEMVSKLGNYMGLDFDEIIYSIMTEDFGGHPFLIRHLCSKINDLSPNERPVKISKPIYQKAKREFVDNYANYLQMILNVLETYYKDEYKMLECLAFDDVGTFNKMSSISADYSNHLIGYGLIEKYGQDYSFRIEVVKEFIIKKSRYKNLSPTLDDIYLEISNRRNTLERKIRKIVKQQIQSSFGKKEGREKIIALIDTKRKDKFSTLNFNELFDPNKSSLFLLDFIKIMVKYWQLFENVFSRDKNKFERNMETINEYRVDAHAKNITEDEFQFFRICITEVEKQVSDYLD